MRTPHDSALDRSGRLESLRPTGALRSRIDLAAGARITASARHRLMLAIYPAFLLAGTGLSGCRGGLPSQ